MGGGGGGEFMIMKGLYNHPKTITIISQYREYGVQYLKGNLEWNIANFN